MRIAILSAGDGWHVRDLRRAARQLGHAADAVDFRRITAAVAAGVGALHGYDGGLGRALPPGAPGRGGFPLGRLQRLGGRAGVGAGGGAGPTPPRAVEACVDKYLATARLAAASLRVPPTVVCQHADDALAAFEALGGDVVVKPLFGSEGRGMLRVADP